VGRVVVVFSILVGVAAAARAESEPRYALSYERPAGLGCPSAAALRAEVALELGYDPFTDEAVITSIVVAIHAAAHGVRGRIEMREIDGVSLGARDLTAGSCAELTPALALAIAVAIDPLRAGTSRAPPAAAPATAPPATATTAPATTAATAPPGIARPAARRPRFVDAIRLRMAVGAGASIDSAPGPAFGFAARVGAATPRASLSLELRGDLPAGRETLGGSAVASLMAVLLVACAHHRGLGVCALGGAGGQEVSGSGYLSAKSFWVPWAALGGRIELALPVSRQLAVTLHVDLLAPITRTQLQLGSSRPLVVYRTAPLCNTFEITLSTRLS